MDSTQISPVRLPNPTAEGFMASLKVVHFFAIIFFWLLLVSLLLHLAMFVLVQTKAFDETEAMGYVPSAVGEQAAPQPEQPVEGGESADESGAVSQPQAEAGDVVGDGSEPWWTSRKAEAMLIYIRPLMAAMRLVGSLSSVLLLVTLFIYLQISLLGRLAGVRYLTVSFFLMMFCVATVFSWEPLLPGTRILGSLYLLEDLFQHKQELGRQWLQVGYYWLRFLVMPLVSIALLMGSWLRFRRGYEESVLMNE